jgi:hypothetical protein
VPDTVVEGEGEDYAAVQGDQLTKVLDRLEDAVRALDEAA